MELRGFNLRGSGCSKFSAPSSGKTVRQTPNSFRGARMCSRSAYHNAKFGRARISPAAEGQGKVWGREGKEKAITHPLFSA